ncbi:MAG: flagellin, partial [Deltaproteobacteria bacterium]|nr:flagellin [Deltaproteobacteria bacterium]
EQSANGSLSSRQRSSLQSEYAQLLQEFARTASTTTFNSQSLALADRGGLSRLNIQSGINGSANSILSTALLDTGSLSGTIGLTHIPTDDSATLTAFSAFAATNPTAEQILERYSVIHHVSLEGAPAGEDMFLVFFRDPEANFMIAKGLVREGAGNTYAEAEFEGEKTTNDSIGFDFDQNGVITAGTAQQTLTIFDTSPSFHGNITLDYRALRLLQGDTSAIDFTGLENASRARVALDVVTARIGDLASQRGQIGATSSRIQASLAVTNAAKENTAAALSRVRDVDVAMESSQLISQTLLKQAAISVLAQANQQPQLAISLLRA